MVIDSKSKFFLDGPGSNKLLNGDEILAVNDEDVEFASRNYVINLIRSCNEKIKLIVKQPTVNLKFFKCRLKKFSLSLKAIILSY